MGLNCKPGDLAVVVAAEHKENIGRIVEVVRAGPVSNSWWIRHIGRPGVTDRGLVWDAWSYDRELRPLRDSPGDDETLTWAGKPQALEVA